MDGAPDWSGASSQDYESERLRVLRQYTILDTPPEADFDYLTRLAARLCQVPIATISLLDECRQWFKSVIGLNTRETARDIAFCNVAIRGTGPFIVPDTHLDPRFRHNPLVTGAPHLRFYAGIPLISPEGLALGTLCVMDRKPHELTAQQQSDLLGLAGQAMAQLELRRQRARLRDLLRERETVARQLQRQADHLESAQRIAQIGSWEHDVTTGRISWSPECCHIMGVRREQSRLSFADFLERIHPEDRTRVLSAHNQAVQNDLPLDLEYRIIHPGGDVRAIHVRAQLTGDAQAPARLLAGTVQDVTERKRAEQERQHLLEREHAARVAAQKAEALFRAGFDNLLVGFSISAPDGTLIAVNPRYCEMVGYREDELLGKPIAAFTDPGDWPRNAELLGQLARGEIQHFTFDKHYIHQDGHRVPARLFVTPLKDESGGTGTVAIILDITQEADAFEKLRQSQWLTGVAGRIARLGGWAIDVATGEMAWSDEVSAIHDLPPGTVPDFDAGVRMFAPEWQEPMRKLVETCRRDGTPYDVEAEKITATGRRVWVRAIGQVQRDSSGNIVRLFGALQDVTEAHNARVALARMADQLRTTLESITDAFVTIDPDWKFTYINREAERLLRYSREDLIGKSMPEAFPDFSGSPFDAALRRAFRENSAVSVEDYYPPLERWFQAHAYPSSEGLAIYFQDVSARHEAQAKLEQAWERTRRILETSRDVIALIDPDGRFVEVNSRAMAVWGLAPEYLVGRHALDLVHPDDRQAASVLWMRDHPSTDGATFQGRCLLPNGALAQVHWSSVWSGQDQLFFVVARDVTELVAAEERMRQSQRLEAVGQLTGGVAHDFNNLLTVVLGSAEMLSEQLAGHPGLDKFAGMIRNAAQRGAELTRSLLAFARRQALEPVVVSVPNMLERLEPLLRRTLSETIDIQISWPADIWYVLADPGQLEAALLNLCLNARDALPQGGHLRIEANNVALDLSYARDYPDVAPGSYVVISVSDDGTGMPPDVLKRAFDPFFTTKPREKGTGLGLSMVYGFARQSGGHVRLESEPGRGTEVRLYIPRSTGAPLVSETLQPALPGGGNERILVVEDDDLVREFAVDQLSGLGYSVIEARNGRDALNLLSSGKFCDLLFTDVVMPVMNGPELASEVHKRFPGLPILFASGYTDDAIIGLDHSGVEVNLVHKPYSRPVLAARIRALLDRKNSTERAASAST